MKIAHILAPVALLCAPSDAYAQIFSCRAHVTAVSVTTDGLMQIIFRPEGQQATVSYNYCYLASITPIEGSGSNPISSDACKSYYGLFLTAFSTQSLVRMFFRKYAATSDCSTLPPGYAAPVPFPYAVFIEQ